MAKMFFEIIPSNFRFDFLKHSKFPFMISVIAVVLSIFLLFTKGLTYGVDFEGGTEVHVKFPQKPSADEVRSALKPVKLEGALVQAFGEEGTGEFLVRVKEEPLNFTEKKVSIEKSLARLASPKESEVSVRFKEDRLFVKYPGPTDVKAIEGAIRGLKDENLRVASVASFGSESANEYRVLFEGAATRIWGAFDKAFGAGKYEKLQTDYVGAKVGKELRGQAVGAVLVALLFILIYVWFRFDFEFAPGAVAALIHDSIVILGVFSLLGLTFDLPVVAAVLTVVGYSINDTIVIFDRIRENIKKSKDANLEHLIDLSISETMSRTILTSGTSMVAVLSLLFLGGPITFNFALALALGIFVGTYSTIFVASPVTLYFHNYLQRRSA